MAGSVPTWVGRMYIEPGGSGTSAAKRPSTSAISRIVSASSISGRHSRRLLWAKRATFLSGRNSATLPSSWRNAFNPSKQVLA